MNAFITGASGFVGGHLAAALVRRGAAVRGLVRSLGHGPAPGVEFVRGDIADLGLLVEACRGVEEVFHCAAALGASRLGIEGFRAVNVEGTRTLLEAARRAGVRRVVHFSSAGVLGHVKGERAADEAHRLDPRDAYDLTKLEGERVALEAAEQGLDVVIVRPGWAYGPGDRRTFKLVRAVARRRFALVGRGKTVQTPVYIDDLVEGTVRAAEKGRRGEIYHLAGSEVLTVREMAAAIADAVGVRPRWLRLPVLPARAAAAVLGRAFGLFKKEAPLNPGRLAFFVHPKPLDIAKAKRELEYAPAMPFRRGMAQTVDWYRAAGWL
ncbi:MAG: NAD-dependent epimerase/dehydratase family protein [Candidatus Aminicenantes bacterium]|nr:NAD-dependent epimerase/dehydratase family protein [Candidatus Aminicenantes bacterium]